MTNEPRRNVYVGHRYVPKIMDEWDKSISYEGLSIVTYQGGSYTSKKYVPKGIDINNTEYWVMTGNYNAQIENYRKEVRDMQEEVDKKAGKEYVDNELYTLNTQMEKTKTLITPDMTSEQIHIILRNGNKDFKFLSGEYNNLDFLSHLSDPTLIDIPSNVNIEFEKDTILNCPSNSYERYYILRIQNRENITLQGGILNGDRDNHTGETGEWGYGLYCFKSKNITIRDMIAQNCWGDGFAVQNQSEDVLMVNCISDNNRRQGLTVGHVKNFLVDGCVFKNTNGTAPEAGVDVEPASANFIDNLIFNNCHFLNNNGSGLEINIMKMLTDSDNDLYLSILGDNNRFEGNNAGIVYTSGGQPVTGYLRGTIELNNSVLINNTSGVRHANIRKGIMPKMILNNVTIKEWNPYTWAVQSYVDVNHDNASETNVVRYGGLEIYNLDLFTKEPMQMGNPTSCIRVEGSITRPLDIIIDGLSGNIEDLGEYVHWKYGQGYIKFKGDNKYLNEGVTRGQLSIERLNGLTIEMPQGDAIRLPLAKSNKGRRFIFQGFTNNFIIRNAFESEDKLVGDNLFSDSYIEVKSNRITLESDGIDTWHVVEQTGSFKRSQAAAPTFLYTGGSAPTIGTYTAGTYILNYAPRTDESNTKLLMGWFRATNGSDHELGVDWIEHWIDK